MSQKTGYRTMSHAISCDVLRYPLTLTLISTYCTGYRMGFPMGFCMGYRAISFFLATSSTADRQTCKQQDDQLKQSAH